MNKVHKVVYINLDRRADRRAEMEAELLKMGLQAERFSGIVPAPGLVKRPGILGCGHSHLAVLKKARDEGWPNVLIFEDDFQCVVEPKVLHETIDNFFKEFKEDWDVFMLSYSLEAEKPYNDLFGYVLSATTASGYLVNQRFYPALIKVLEDAMVQLQATEYHWHYSNDQVWKTLQPKAKWMYSMVRLGIQRPSYSDNSYEFMDRSV
jgi:GR25 family glycosyltransferase involved in LPS biosynthesis